jgi:hypothetical protein
MNEQAQARPSAPRVSVIVLTSGDPKQARRTVESVRGQTIAAELELVIVRVNPTETLPKMYGTGLQGLQVVTDDGRPFGELRAAAVRAASAPIVAFLEDHCLAEPRWAETLVGAIEDGWAGVGCEMHNANHGIGISEAVGLMNYGVFLAPAERQSAGMIPGHNGAYKRSILISYGQDLGRLLRSDVVLNGRLVADGHRLLLEPAAKVAHANETHMASILRGYYLNTRSMSATRSDEFKWSLAKRWGRILLWPLVPFRRIASLYAAALRSRPDLVGPIVRWTPVMFVAWLATGIGQAMALAFGIGDADRQFLLYEVAQDRPVNFPGWSPLPVDPDDASA